MAKVEKKESEDEAGGEQTEELKPSELDENTHAEMRILYGDSSQALLFAKERQWKLAGAVLLIFVAIMVVAQVLVIEANMAKGLVLASFLVSAAAIYMLIVYQVWQGTESSRQEAIAASFSNMFTRIQGPQGRREGRIHGYIILAFLIFGILLGNAATVFFLSRFYLS
jgi:hypothetical protein